jgi:hypothetical protein
VEESFHGSTSIVLVIAGLDAAATGPENAHAKTRIMNEEIKSGAVICSVRCVPNLITGKWKKTTDSQTRKARIGIKNGGS